MTKAAIAPYRQPARPPLRPRGRPKLDDVLEIETRLLAAALAEFVRHGYGGSSMRSIAAAANVSRTTLLARFATKGDLFRAIMHQQIERMSATTYLRADGGTDLRKGLTAYANRALAYSLEGDLLAINRLIYSVSGQFPEIDHAAMESTKLGIAQVAEFIRQCADADGVPCRDPRVPAEAFTLLLRGWYGCVMLSNRTVAVTERESWVESMVGCLIGGRAAW